ncbi:hypothetical protein FRB93_013737 [Tulasnella sp. JGI-2019a]|nr:hypothetical protein FRB93_013737 [Tulasnella sp. JGI-2019a]
MNACFAASLVTSLLAAFGAVIAKEWLLHYFQTGQVGELEKQCRRRQKKFQGARRWHLQTVVELLPTLLQISLLAFFVGLVDFFLSLNTAIAAVVIGLSGLAFLAYCYTTVVAVRDSNCPFQTHYTRLLRHMLKRTRRYFRSKIGAAGPTTTEITDDAKADAFDLQRECVLWTLQVAEKKTSLLAAARSIPTLTPEACSAILPHPAYKLLLSQLQASLSNSKALDGAGNDSQREAIVLGRALIYILLRTGTDSDEKQDAWNRLSWPGATLSPLPGFEELVLIALSINPKCSDGSSIKCSNISPPSIPLYIACLVTPGAQSQAHEIVIRNLISACLKAPTVPIEHILVCAWALMTLAPLGRFGGRSASDGLRDAYRSDADAALQIIETIKVLAPDSTHQSDYDFLDVVATLVTQLTWTSPPYDSFIRNIRRERLLEAIKPLARAERMAPLRTVAIKCITALSQCSILDLASIPVFHSVRDAIIIDICSDIDANRGEQVTPEFLKIAYEFLKTTCEFAIRIQPDTRTPEYQLFLQYSNQWLRSITHLALTQPPMIRSHNAESIIKTIRSLSLDSLHTIIGRPELTAFWDACTICQVLSCFGVPDSDEGAINSDAMGGLMLRLLKAWYLPTNNDREPGNIDRKHLQAYPEAVETLVVWMKAQSEVLRSGSLAVVDHWSKNWFDHEDEDVHTLFMTAGLAEAMIIQPKSGINSGEAAYDARDRILRILARHTAWSEELISAFNRIVKRHGGLGEVGQAYKSLERETIWRIASVVVEKRSEPSSSAVEVLIPLLGYVSPEEPLEDRKWLRYFPDTAILLESALRQPGSIGDNALKTLDSKLTEWFDHEDDDLHQIFIDRGMARALVQRFYPDGLSEEDAKMRDRTLRVLLRSPPWITSLYRLVISDDVGSLGELGSEEYNVGLRARAVIDLHRLVVEVNRLQGESNPDVGLWMSEDALGVVTRYAEGNVLLGMERARWLSFAEAVLKHKAPTTPQETTDGRHVEPEREEGSNILVAFREVYERMLSANEVMTESPGTEELGQDTFGKSGRLFIGLQNPKMARNLRRSSTMS